jgi:predicted MFS family arabinose efflux permease
MFTTSRKALLGILMAIYVANHLDRVALGLLLEEIKHDLVLTDTQLGLLSGLAFALFYAVMGLPIARWADRGNRVTIISVTAGLWSVAVVLCGAAGNFVQLLLARVCVGIGEAGCVPPAHSLIADYFSRAERPRATSLYTLSGSIAFIIGYFATGWLNQVFDWRMVFAIIGLPGIALAAIAWFTLKEPRTGLPMPSGRQADAHEPVPPVREVLVTLARIPAFRHLLVCFSIWYFFGYGLMQWQPTFFIRSHGLDTGMIGTVFALIIGVAGVVGTLVGGELATRLAAGNERRQLHFGACAFVIFAIFTGCAFLAPSAGLAFAALAVANLGGNLAHGPMLSTIQTLVPPRMRAMSMAIIYLFANMIGLGLGPLAAGMLSDGLVPMFGAESLRYALLALCPGYFWAALHLWLASRKVESDIARAVGSLAADARAEPA